MKQYSRLKKITFNLIMLFIVFLFLELVGYSGLWLNSNNSDFLSNKNFFAIRSMLMGNSSGNGPRYLSLPYLNYIPYPNYQNHGFLQHNGSGYRGEPVPMAKGKKFRVLCLGGSTTYGFGVNNPQETFPAQLEKMLDTYIKNDSSLNAVYGGAEVINAGLEAGNSAEELQQYLFKYRYYKSDAVIVHSGINDALLTATSSNDYQLDYTHYRRLNFHLEALPSPTRFLMHSYFFSFISIQLFFSEFSKNKDEFIHQHNETFCRWTQINADSVVRDRKFDYYPFYRNSNALYSQILADSAVLLSLPNVLNNQSTFTQSNEKYRRISDLNNLISKDLVKNYGAIYINFTYDSIQKPNCWIDDCHLNTEGERNKAQIILPYLIKVVRNESNK